MQHVWIYVDQCTCMSENICLAVCYVRHAPALLKLIDVLSPSENPTPTKHIYFGT